MALQRLKDAAEKAKCDLSQLQSDRDQPALHRARRRGDRVHLNVRARPARSSRSSSATSSSGPEDRRAVPAPTPGSRAQQIDQVMLVGGQTRMPLVQKRVAEFFGKRPHKGVNPDEVVAIGAAIQAAMLLRASSKDLLLLDVTPLSLGIATFGGHFAQADRAQHDRAASRQEHVFTTTRDNQTAVKIRVLQGESDTRGRRTICSASSCSRASARRRKGEPEIEVSFDIDANGIVSVSARDLATGTRAVDHRQRDRDALGRRDREDHRRPRALRGPAQGLRAGSWRRNRRRPSRSRNCSRRASSSTGQGTWRARS